MEEELTKIMTVQQDASLPEKSSLNVPKNTDVEQNATDIAHGATVVLGTSVDNGGYHRKLTRRQIMMTTFGAGVGTGLYVLTTEDMLPVTNDASDG